MRQLRSIGTRRRSAPLSLRRAIALAVVRTWVCLAAVVTSYVAGGVLTDLSARGSGPEVRHPDPAVAMMAEHRCSTAGLADGEVPASTLIRTPDGEVRQVSFARGWQVHLRGGPAVLVAVCRGPLG